MNEIVLNREHDFSNIIVDENHLLVLVRFLDGLNKQLIRLTEEDEEKNKQFKDEYKEYQYKQVYSQQLEVYIKYENYTNNITCKDYESFSSAVSNGRVKNIKGIDISLHMDFKRGKGNDLFEHENLFNIKFEPYRIIFIRKSNREDTSMDQIENKIISIMNEFNVVNTVFCYK